MSKTKLYKFMTTTGHIRASAIVCTALLEHLRGIQQTSPTSTLALGRGLIGTTLLASQLKDEQALSMQIHCDGPMRMLFAQASYEGSIRAYIAEPNLPMSVERGNLILAPHVGKGTLTISTYVKGATQPQRSQVLLQSGEITEDFAHYIRLSQQIPCVLNTGITLGSEGVVTGAGGILVELMPGHTEEDVERVESAFKTMGSLSNVFPSGNETPVNGEDLLRLFFVGIQGKFWDHPYAVQIACSCNLQKVVQSFRLLGAEELQEMIDKKETVDVQCEMCGKRYKIEGPKIKEIYQELKKLH